MHGPAYSGRGWSAIDQSGDELINLIDERWPRESGEITPSVNQPVEGGPQYGRDPVRICVGSYRPHARHKIVEGSLAGRVFIGDPAVSFAAPKEQFVVSRTIQSELTVGAGAGDEFIVPRSGGGQGIDGSVEGGCEVVESSCDDG